MNKRKRATPSKHAHSQIAAKAQRAAHATVRSPAGGTTPPKRQTASLQEAVLENFTTPFKDQSKQTMVGKGLENATNFSSAMANIPAFQSKLLEMAQANMQLAFEFTQRLATIKSPLEFPSVIAEFTRKRIAMFQKQSSEMAGLGIRP